MTVLCFILRCRLLAVLALRLIRLQLGMSERRWIARVHHALDTDS